MFSTTFLSKTLSVTVSSSVSALTATTGSFSGAVNIGAALTVSNGNTTSLGTSGTTSPLNVFGLITGNNGLTISSGTAALQAITATTLQTSGLLTAQAGVTSSNGQTVNVGTSGVTSSLNVFGTATITTLVASAGTLNGTLTVSNGNTLNVGTSGATSSLNVFGTTTTTNLTVSGTLTLSSLTVTGSTTLAGLSAGSTTLTSLSVTGTTSLTGALSANSATFANGSTVSVGTSGTSSPLNVFGLITGNNGLVISTGSSTFQGISGTTLNTSGLITANSGITITSGLLTTSSSGASVAGPLVLSSRVQVATLSTVSTSYTVAATDYLVEFTAPTGTVTVNLPTLSSSLGRVLIFVNSSTVSASLVITPNGTDKIDGSNTTVPVPINSAISLVGASQSWYIT